MKKILSGKIKLKDINHIENSRMRGANDVSDLMQDIEQRGLLENVGIRKSDNALIFGNRRVKAFEKLGYDEIDCDYYTEIDDNELLIANLAENMKRRDIGTIEIGRIIDILLKRDLTVSEIAVKLAIPAARVSRIRIAYNAILGTKFERALLNRNKMTKDGISETLIWKMQTSLTKARKNRILSKKDWDVLFDAAQNQKLIVENVSTLRNILFANPGIEMLDAISLLDRSKTVHLFITLNLKELYKEMQKSKADSESQFLKNIIKEKYPNLSF